MANVILYEVDLKGIKTAIANQDDLTRAIKETKAEFKKAEFGTKEYQDLNRQLNELETSQQQIRKNERQNRKELELAAAAGEQSYRGLNAQLTIARNRYKDLAAAEQETTQEARQLLQVINQLDSRLKEIDTTVGQNQRNIGDYTQAFQQLGGIDFAGLLTGPGAILAIGAAAGETVRFLFDLTEEFRTLRGEIENLNVASDEQLGEFTARISAIERTFGATQEEILTAANAVSKQLGIDFGEALDRIETGFVRGDDASGQFLDSLSEYPAFFKEAELGADTLFNVINRSVQQGIYTDKGVDTIKEATLRLRELPTATIAALENLGISADQVQQKIGEEGIGSAIALVSEKLGQLEEDSPAVGQALADIFGGPGEDAGLQFILSLQDLNEETATAIDQSNEYQQQQQRTLEVNQEYARVAAQVAEQLSGQTSGFKNLVTIIQTGALQVLSFLIERVQTFFAALRPIGAALTRLGQALGFVTDTGKSSERAMAALNLVLQAGQTIVNIWAAAITFAIDQVTALVGGIVDFLEYLGILDDDAAKAAAATEDLAAAAGDAATETSAAGDTTEETTNKIKDYTKATTEAAVATETFANGSIAQLRQQVQKLKQDLEEAAPANQAGILEQLLGAEKALEAAETLNQELRNRLTITRDTIEPLNLIDTDLTRVKAEQSAEEVIAIVKDRNERLLEEERKRAEQTAAIREEVFNLLGDSISQIASAEDAINRSQLQQIEERYATEIALAEGNADRQEELEAQLAEEKQRLEEAAFQQQKKFRVAAAITSLAEGIVNILAAPSTIPDPFGTAFKAIRIGILTATTAKQIAAINRQTAERGILMEDRRIPLNLSAAFGGRIVDGIARGATHGDRSGGIAIAANGLPVLVENGEAIDRDEYGATLVINKRSSARFGPTLKALRGITFSGKRGILSAINQAGGGIPLAQTGAILQPAVQSVAAATTTAGAIVQTNFEATIAEASIRRLAAATGEEVATGARQGVEQGLQDANRRAEREARLAVRTGLQT